MHGFTNNSGVPLSVAVYLATDHYDYESDTISATSLLKPIRQVILASRVPDGLRKVDVLNFIKSRMGTSIHDGIEKAWKDPKPALEMLGYPEEVINNIVVNPDPDSVTPEQIPVYMEQRKYKQIEGKVISGKFDFVAEGRLEDFKSTSTYAWSLEDRHEDFKLQGSIYRWISPEIITEDVMAIQYIFTDWFPSRAKNNPRYPQKPTEELLIPLLTIEETEQYIVDRLRLFDAFKDAGQDELPLCTDKELWRKPAQFKYYKNPEKRNRSTANFDNAEDAYIRKAKDGNVGVVVEVPGQVMACNYCPAFPICKQKDDLIADGSLVID